MSTADDHISQIATPPANSDDPATGLCERSAILIGDAGCERLARAQVLVAGLGGVGGHAAEALARAGIGRLTLVDGDRVAPSNLNRQLVALHSTLGQSKVAVMAARLGDINPKCQIERLERFVAVDDIAGLALGRFDAVVDAIDSLSTKVALLAACLEAGVPVFSSMGAGSRLDPGAIRISDLMHSQQCPLARAVRQQLRRLGHGKGVLAVWSQETAHPPLMPAPGAGGHAINGTISYMPALFGLTLAGCAIRRLLEETAPPE
ncbi:tRNA threonylcarbamoyladenosine dehydratase [Thiorhodovibrio frisius]|uniref:Dinucleotide-utilizing enzyme possibly involved in molybdopterin or thiamin biosynthesis n=1 Tax=Thiorhodovibrio frisius TaxID=631362 RepID=H8Z0D5_9GAMM|nr:tRNA threonylcarbamoyladenosine dehydratase [Thiorhodovibrio frisius]EIC21236.1 dinucleotide-utilizing enzyme possibly involved in molybdopterin or thiamin biosynthesis [Thiorhodovibrio frisius]WPL23812.1 Molybdopterin-synthase adenylyltransferase [Thiorhodovibrio frisius]